MLGSSWLGLVFRVMGRAVRRRKARAFQYRPCFRWLELEVLENRIAPTVSATFTPASGLLSVASNAADPMAISIVGSNVKVNNADPTGGPVAAAAVKQLQITGGPGNNLIDLSPLVAGALPNLVAATVTGGAGTDTLVGPNQANTWNISGTNQGTVGLITFAGVKNLTGGNQADTFAFGPAGTVTGVIDGGLGALTLDGGAGTLTISNTVMAEGQAGVSLTGNAINVLGSVFTNGGNLTATAPNISVGTSSAVVTLSTRQVAPNADPATASSTGNSGSIIFNATHIGITNGARLLAQVEPGSVFTPGDIRLTAKASTVVRTNNQDPPTATITLDHATLKGNEVALTANSAERFGVFGFKKDATANIDVGNSTIVAGNVDLKSLADTRTIPDFTASALSGNPSLTFHHEPSGTGDWILRSDAGSGGSWVTDKFLTGQAITVKGTNNNDGTYVVTLATADKLFLKPGDVLKDEVTNPATQQVAINGTLVLPDPETIFDTLFPGFRGSAVVTLSKASSEVRVTGASSIVSAGNVTITSTSQSRATPYFPGLAIPGLLSTAAVWADSTAAAQASLEDTAQVKAGSAFTLNAATTNNVDAMAMANARNKPINLVFAGAKTTDVTNTFVASGASVQAGQANVESDSENDLGVAATVANQGASGAGLAVATSFLQNNNNAYIAGHVTTTSGDVTVQALANTINNSAETDARELGSTSELPVQISNAYNQAGRDLAAPLLSATGNNGSLNPLQLMVNKLFPVIKSGKFNLSGAVTILEATNNVNAYIDKLAQVTSAGNVGVKALLTDRTNTAAVGAATSDKVAAGGAVVFADYTNHVNAYVGQQAVVNAQGDVEVNSQFALPYPWQVNFNSPDLVLTYINGNIRNLVLTSYAENTSGGDKLAAAGAVNIQLFDNQANAYIDTGAHVTAGSVIVSAISNVNTLNVAGATAQWNFFTQLITNQASQQLANVTNLLKGSLPQSLLGRLQLTKMEDPKAGIGGAVSVFTFNDGAVAEIKAGANVTASGSVSVTSQTEDRLISVDVAHGKGQKLAVFGAGSGLTLNSTTIAFIDSTANVSAGGQINVHATNDPRAYSFTGGVALHAAVGIGLSASVAQVNSVVKSFIGPQTALSGKPALTFQGVAVTGGPALTFTHVAASGNPALTFSHVGLTGAPILTFTPNNTGGDTIGRSTGRWDADGFQAGQSITVSGTASDDGVYQIASISADGKTLILTQSGGLTQEQDPGGSLQGTPTLTFKHVALTGNPALTFTPSGGGDTIVRSDTASGGSWLADGFQPNQSIQVTGSAGNSGTYKIAAVTADTLTLVQSGVLTSETTSIVSVFAPDVPATITRDTGNWSSDLFPSGFKAGQAISITGTTNNDGIYHVAAVSPDGKTLTLAQGEEVNNETIGGVLTGNPALTFTRNATGGDTIARSAGSWSADGFAPGQTLTISGTAADDGTYQIAAVSADGTTLTLSQSGVVTTETDAGASASASSVSVVAGPVTVTAQDTITRTDGGTWTADGFRAGQNITVAGTAGSDGTYQIASVSADGKTLTLAQGDAVASEADAGGVLTGNPSLTFTPNAGGGDTIQRSAGSWSADGFHPGQTLTVTGSAHNNGKYQVAAVSADGATLTLAQGGVLTSETASGVQAVGVLNVNGPDLVARSGGNFLTDGFQAGQVITVSGSAANNGSYVVGSVAPILSGNLALTFTRNAGGGDTIQRSSGSWSADGFQPGHTITVAGSAADDGTYQIASVSPDGTTLTLSQSQVLTTESDTGVSVSDDSVMTLRAVPGGVTGNPTLTFTSHAGGGDTITRSDTARGGSWFADGFQAGQTITVAGSAANDGSYQIASISPDGSTLTLTASSVLKAETDAGVSVTAGSPVRFHNEQTSAAAIKGQDTITRAQGSWIADGFVPGQTVTVTGAGADNGTYQVAGVTDGTLTLTTQGQIANSVTSGAVITNETLPSPTPTVRVEAAGLTFTHVAATGNPGLKFAHLGLTGSPTLTFAPNAAGDTITRSDTGSGGSWLADGFQANETITVAGSAGDDGTYQIASLTAGTLTLKQKNVLQALTTTNSGALTGTPTLTFVHTGLTGTPTLTFTHNAGGGDTIQRSAGSWSADGFVPNQSIAVEGTGLVNNDGTYTIASVSADGLTLTLAQGDLLVNETVTGGVAIIAPQTPDRIVRSSGSWSADGFKVGQPFTIAGSASNDGTYQIAGISADGLTLTLAAGEVLNNEVAPGGVTVASKVTVNALDTIKRMDGITWGADGFAVGQSITVAGSANNDGVYLITAISADGSTLTLGPGNVLSNETDPAGRVSVNGPDLLGRPTPTPPSQGWVTDGFQAGQVITISGTARNDGTYAIGAVTPTLLTLTPTSDVVTGNPTLTFAQGTGGAGDTITRSQGSWVADGFHAGQSLTVTGSVANNGVYQVAAVSASTLTLVQSGVLTNETDANGAMSGSPGLIFTHDKSGQGDTITRRGGSWLADGFKAGQTLTVANSQSNDGSYQIAAISPDGHTLTLVHGAKLTNENEQNNNLPFVGGVVFSLPVLGGIVSGLPQVTQPITITSSTSVSAPLQFHSETTTKPATFTTAPIAAVIGIAAQSASGSQIFSLSLAGTEASEHDAGEPDAGTQGTGSGASSAGQSGAAAAQAGKGKFGIGASGSVSINTVSANTLSYVKGASVSSNSLDVQSQTSGDPGGASSDRKTAITAATGSITINTNTKSAALAGTFSQNTLTGETGAFVENSQAALTADLDVTANTGDHIIAVGISGAGAGKVGIAGQVSRNIIGLTTDARVDSGSTAVTDGPVVLNATDGSLINADAGGVAFAISRAGSAGLGAAIAVAGSAALNQITNHVLANIDQSVVSGSTVGLTASETAAIQAVSIAGAVSASNNQGGVFAASLAGAGSGNTIADDTEATITGGSTVTAFAGEVSLTAVDQSSIAADAGGAALALALGKGNDVGVSVGASFVYDAINNTVVANIDGSTVSGVGTGSAPGLEVTAKSKPFIQAVTIAGAAAVASGMTGVAVSAAGAGSYNTVGNTVRATITGGSVATTSAGPVVLTAVDTSSITADAGGLSLGLALGKSTNVAITLGAAVAVNSIDNSILASINDATVTSAGDLRLIAATVDGTSEQKIFALTLGIAGALATGGQGIAAALSGAGSGSDNEVKNRIEASIRNSNTRNANDRHSVTTQGTGSVVLTATDQVEITAAAGAAAIAIASGKSGGSGAFGVSVAINGIGSQAKPNSATAVIDNSSVTAGGGVQLNATSTPAILAVTVAGSFSGASTEAASVTFAGAGAGSQNKIFDNVQALITGGSAVSSGNAQPVALTARDLASINADAGGLGLGFAGGKDVGVSGALGAAAAVNSITDTIKANIDDSTVTSAGDLDLTATTENGLAFNPQSAGAVNLNTSATNPNSLVFNSDPHLQTGDPVLYSPKGGTAIGGLNGGQTYYAIVTNNGTSSTAPTQWYVQLAKSLDDAHNGTAVSLTGTGSGTAHQLTYPGQKIFALTLGIAGALASGGQGVGVGLAGAGSGSDNQVSNAIEASITNSNTKSASDSHTVTTQGTGAVNLTALNDSEITAAAGAAAIAIGTGKGGGAGAVGCSVAVNSIGTADNPGQVTAGIENSQVNAAGAVSLDAESTASILSITVAGGVGVGVGKEAGVAVALAGAGSQNMIHTTVQAVISAGSVVTTGIVNLAGQAVSLRALDNSHITADAGGLSLAFAGGKDAGGAGALGAAAAVNSIGNSVIATIDSSTVTSAGAVNLTATTADANDPTKPGETIFGLAIGVAGSLASGGQGVGVSLAGAGSGVSNTIGQQVQTFDGVNGVDLPNNAINIGGLPDFQTGEALVYHNGGGASIGTSTGPLVDGQTYYAIVNPALQGEVQLASSRANALAGTALTLTSAGAGSQSLTAQQPNVVKATVVNGSHVTSNARQNVTLTAVDQAKITGAAGSAAIAIAAGQGGGTGAVGVSVAVNTITNTVLAAVQGATVSSAAGVVLDAESTASILSVTVAGAFGFAKSEAAAGSFAGAGAGSQNTINDSVQALINGGSNVTSSNSQPVSLTARDLADINADAGGISLGFAGGQDVGVTGALGAAASVNSITDTIKANIDDSTVTSAGDLDLTATTENGLAFNPQAAGAVNLNTSATNPNSLVFNSDPHLQTGDPVLYCANGGTAIGGLTSGNTYYAIVTNNGTSSTPATQWYVQLAATSNDAHRGNAMALTSTGSGGSHSLTYPGQKIFALALGISGALASGGQGLGLGLAGAGSGTNNQVSNAIEASITNSNTKSASDSHTVTTQGTGAVNLTALNDTEITAASGSLAVAIGLGSGAGSGAVGIGLAINTIGSSSNPNSVMAVVNNSNVAAAGPVSLDAESQSSILAITVAAAGAVSSSQQAGGGAFAGAGAGSGNTIAGNVEALIEGGSTVSSGTGNAVSLTARDNSNIEADAGGLSLGIGVGGSLSGSLSIGAAAAINNITNTVEASVIGSTVNSGGDVDLLATTETLQGNAGETILAIAVGVAGSLGSSSQGGGIALAGAGSGSGNTITNTVEASIKNSTGVGNTKTPSNVTTAGSGQVNVTALDKSKITAGAGALGISVANGNAGGVAVAAGVSAAANSIGSSTAPYHVTAAIEDSTVSAGGGVTLDAESTSTIFVVTVAGSVSVAKAESFGAAFGVAGAGSQNVTYISTQALIGDTSNVTSHHSQDVSLTAKDSSTITANGGGVGIAVAPGASVGLAVGIGAGYANNTISNTTTAGIDDSTVTSAGKVSLTANGDNSSISAVAFGVAVAVTGNGEGVQIAGAGSGAGSYNTITDTVQAYIQNGSNVTANATGADAVNLSATDNASITANSGAGSLAFSFVPPNEGISVSVAVAAVVSNNTIGNTVQAFIGLPGTGGTDTTLVTSAGGVKLAGSSGATINALGVAVAASFGVDFAGAGSGAQITNTIGQPPAQNITVGTNQVDTTNSNVTNSAFVGMATGQPLIYHNGGGSNLGPLTDGGIYYVIGGTAGQIKLADSKAHALSNSALTLNSAGNSNQYFTPVDGFSSAEVDTTKNTITDSSLSGLTPGQAVVYHSGGNNAAPLADGGTYYVIVNADNPNIIMLAGSKADALAGKAIGLTSAGGDNQSLTPLSQAGYVTAAIQNGATVHANGAAAADKVTLTATDTSSITSNVGTGGLSVGIVGASVGVSLTTNILGNQVSANITGATVTTAGANVELTSTATDTANGKSVATAVSVSIGGAGAGGNSTTTDDTVTQAFVGAGANVTTNGGDLDVHATSTPTLTAETDGGAGGIAAIGATVASATLGGATRAYVGEGVTVHAGNVDVKAESTQPTGADNVSSKSILVAIGAGGVTVLNTTSTINDTTEAFIGPEAGTTPTNSPTSITVASGGTVNVNANSTTTATSTPDGGNLGVTVSVTVSFATTNLDGASNAYLGGHLTLNAKTVDVTAQSNNTASASTVASVSIGLVGGTGAQINSDVGHNVAAYVEGGANVNVTGGGALNVQATSNETTTATVNGGSGGAVNISAMFAGSQINGNTQAYVGEGATVTAGSLDVAADAATRDATTNSFVLSISVLAGGAGANTSAFVGGTTEAFTGPQAGATPTGSQTTINVPGAVKITADSVSNPSVTSTVGGGGVIAGAAAAITNAQVGNNSNHPATDEVTRAYLGDNTVIGSSTSKAALVQVLATAADVATTEATVGSGGVLSGRGTDAEANLNTIVEAYIGKNVTVYASGSNVPQTSGTEFIGVDVEATSLRAEGHATGKSFGGGGLDVGIPHATTTSKPTVLAWIDSGSSVYADGNVKVLASNLAQPAQTFNDQIQAVNSGIDTNGQHLDEITFPSHGLLTGDQVVYAVNSSATPIQTPSPSSANTSTLGAIDNGNARVYNVIAVNKNNLQLGDQFNAVQVNASDILLPLDGVDPTRNVIRFPAPHHFQTGDAVHYDTNGGGSISTGLNTSGTYYVRVIDAFSVKLYSTYAGATAGFTGFDPNSKINNSTFQFLPSGFTNQTAVTYLAPAPDTFHSTDVDSDTRFLDLPMTSSLKAGTVGEPVVYQPVPPPPGNPPPAPLAGLMPGHTYYVDVFQASGTSHSGSSVTYNKVEFFNNYADATHKDNNGKLDNHNAIDLQPNTTDQRAITATVEVKPLGLGGLTDGQTYYVAKVDTSKNTFQLATDSAGTNLVTISVPQGTAGTYTIGLDGIALNNLANAHGTQDLHIAFSSPSTTSPTGDELLEPVVQNGALTGFSLRVANPPAGSGQSASDAEGGSGGAFEFSFPVAVTTLDPTVKAYVDAHLVQSAADVTIASENIGNTNANANNGSGGFIDVSTTSATTHFGESGGTLSTSEAFVGSGDPTTGVDATGVTINAGGAFKLSSDTQLTTNPTANTDGGGFIKGSAATGEADMASATYTTVGANAQIHGRNVAITSALSNASVNVHATASAYGFAGVAVTHANSTGNSAVQTEIGGGTTTVTGDQGVDVTAQNLNWNPSLNPYSTSSALWIPFHDTGEENTTKNGTFTTNVLGDANSNGGATIVAGPRPASSPLVAASSIPTPPPPGGLPHLALYVQAHDNNVVGPGEQRFITWNANVTITSGPAPYLVIDSTGKIVADDNVGVSDGSLNSSESNPLLSVGDSITSGTAGVHDISGAHIGQAYFTSDDNNSIQSIPNAGLNPPYPSAHPYPLFNFNYSFGKVTIINNSSNVLEIHKINVVDTNSIQNGSGETDVQIQSPGQTTGGSSTTGGIPFKFRIAHTVGSTQIDIENRNTAVAASNINLTDVILNPVGQTIIKDVRGSIEATAAAAAVWTNVLDVEASVDIGSATRRIPVELIESADPNGNLRPIVFTATATSGSAYFDLTARRRDSNTGLFTVPIASITAGTDIDVLLEPGWSDPAPAGSAHAITVGVENDSGSYTNFFHPDDTSGTPGLDAGVFVGTTPPSAITTTYDFQPVTGQVDGSGAASGAAGLTAGGNIKVNAAKNTAADPTINVVGTTDLTGPGYVDTVTNGSINYGEVGGGPLRAGTISSTNSSVLLTNADLATPGQDLDVVQNDRTNGLVSAKTTVVLNVGDNLTTFGNNSPAGSMITAGTSITINLDQDPAADPDPGDGSTVNINGSLSSPLTDIFGNAGDDTVNLNYADGVNTHTTAVVAALTNLTLAKVVVDLGGGTANRLKVDDSGDGGADSGFMTNNMVFGIGMGGLGVFYSQTHTQHLEIDLSQGGTTTEKQGGIAVSVADFTVYSTNSITPTLIKGGAGNDIINVASTLAAPPPVDPHLPTLPAADQGDLNTIQAALTVNGNGGADSIQANDHGKLYTINNVVQYAVDDNGKPVVPVLPLHVNDDGLPATNAPAAGLGPNYQYTANDPAYGYNYIVTPTTVLNDPSTVATIPAPTTPPPRTFAGINYNTTGNPSQDTVTFVRLDGTDRANRFTVTPDTKKVTTFLIDGNEPDNACRKDGGDYLNLDTTHMGAPGSDAVFSRRLHIFNVPYSFAGTIDGKNYYPDLPAAGAGDFNGQTVPAPTPGTPPATYIPATPGVDSGELSSPTGNGFWDFTRKGTTYAKPVYFLSIERFNHVAKVATGADASGSSLPVVNVRDAETGDLLFTATAYPNFFHGGVRVAMGDMNCDGLPDLVTAPGPGYEPLVEVFDGSPDANGNYQHKLLTSFDAYAKTLTTGLFVAIGDVNYDGHNDLVTGAGAGWLPQVRVFDGRTVLTTHGYTFFNAFDQSLRGGVYVAAGDLNNDGYVEIVAGLGAGASPQVNIFDGKSYANVVPANNLFTPTLVRTLHPFQATDYGGTTVAVGDFNGDGTRDVLVGVAGGWLPMVTVYSGQNLFGAAPPTVLTTFQTNDSSFRGGVRLAVQPIDGGNPGTVERVALFVGFGVGNNLKRNVGLVTYVGLGVNPKQVDWTTETLQFVGGIFVG